MRSTPMVTPRPAARRSSFSCGVSGPMARFMHEFSQAADFVDWNALPYLYAEADATPLLLMVLEDYLATSGDSEFVRRHWEEAKKAYSFVRAHDSDTATLYENTEGTGWVESWPSGDAPHQEIYLAAIDQQGTRSFQPSCPSDERRGVGQERRGACRPHSIKARFGILRPGSALLCL